MRSLLFINVPVLLMFIMVVQIIIINLLLTAGSNTWVPGYRHEAEEGPCETWPRFVGGLGFEFCRVLHALRWLESCFPE